MENQNIKNNSIDLEDDDDELVEIEGSDGKPTYVKKLFGSGVKNRTEKKQAQCPICLHYYSRVNEQHLKAIHKMTLEELEKVNPEQVIYFTDPTYAIENSKYAKDHKSLPEVKIEEKGSDGVELVQTEKYLSNVLDEICSKFGMDRNDENFSETPKRIAKALQESLKGEKDTEKQLAEIFKASSTFPSDYPGIIVETNIRAYGKCPHHLETIVYNVHLAYKPRQKKVGLSKLARCVDVLCSRLRMQETVTDDIVKAIQKYLEPEGVAICVDAKHFCMSGRGCKQENVITSSNILSGCFLYDDKVRNEFYQNINRTKKDF